MLILLNALKPGGIKSIVGACMYTISPDQDQTGVNSKRWLKRLKESSLIKKLAFILLLI